MEKNKIMQDKWVDFDFNLNNSPITTNLIEDALNKFWLENIVSLEVDPFFLIQFKIKDPQQKYKSISYVQTFNVKDYNLSLDIFI